MKNIGLSITEHEKTCRILIDVCAIDHMKEYFNRWSVSARPLIILFDEAVESVAKKIADQIDDSHLISVHSGEASKSLEEVERITKEMLKLGVNRHSMIVNVGGGVLTDLGGFVASIYMRGIPFFNVPTTLLGMVDAGIGGKTGVNLGMTKNILGTFSHPYGVIIDTSTIETLSDDHMREGLAEVVKITAMRESEAFSWLEEHIDQILQRDQNALLECIEQAVRLKVNVVELDEKEGTFMRMQLNFGHTVGHAIETASGFGISHGKAISIGMATEMNMRNTKDRARVISLLQHIGMPTEIPDGMNADELWNIMLSDKKVSKGKVIIAAPSFIGAGTNEMGTQSVTREDFHAACS